MGGMGIVEFLTARLDEDEQVARSAISPRVADADPSDEWVADPYNDDGIERNHVRDAESFTIAEDVTTPRATHIARFDPARVLAEVTAKRAIVHAWITEPDSLNYWQGLGVAIAHLAAVYADHPDYQQEWKP